MRELLEILNGVEPDIDFTTAEGILSNDLISEEDIPSVIADIEDTFGVEISESMVTEENFDSAETIWNLIQELQVD